MRHFAQSPVGSSFRFAVPFPSIMKILVLAQTPPPIHGQSLMVRAMIEGLPALGIRVRHVPMALSTSNNDVGRWRLRKVSSTIRAGFAARRIARAEDIETLYYVPAPGKSWAVWRDVMALRIARPAIPRLVLHWHGSGLGEWIPSASALLRRSAHRALGAADLSVVLAPELVADAAVFNPRRTEVVANGIPDPGEPTIHGPNAPTKVLFVGLGSREKGLIDTAEAIALLHKSRPNEFTLTFAGNFATKVDEVDFRRIAESSGSAIRYAGFAGEFQKHELLSGADIFCFPTYYPHEGQPLSLIEAMAHDVRIVTTRWRAIPGMLPSSNVTFVDPKQPTKLAAALESSANMPPPNGALRNHYLKSFTLGSHLEALRDALLRVGGQ